MTRRAIAAGVLTALGGLAATVPPPGEMERCLELIRAEQFAAARQRLEPIVAAHPAWQRAVFLLGLSYHEEQRYGEARGLLERALEIDPASSDAGTIRLFYGWALYYLGRPAEAREQFESFLETRPGVADAHFALGLIEFDRDDVPAATSRFKSAIRLARQQGDARTEGRARARLADVLVRTGKLAAARAELEAAVRLRPDAYEAYFKLSRVLERLGDSAGAERARESYRQARERARSDAPPM